MTAGSIVGAGAVDAEAFGGLEGREINHRPTGLAVNQIGRARGHAVDGRARRDILHDDIVQAIAIEITSFTAKATMDDEAVGGRTAGQLCGRKGGVAGLAEEDVGLVHTGWRKIEDDVATAVAIDILNASDLSAHGRGREGVPDSVASAVARDVKPALIAGKGGAAKKHIQPTPTGLLLAHHDVGEAIPVDIPTNAAIREEAWGHAIGEDRISAGEGSPACHEGNANVGAE